MFGAWNAFIGWTGRSPYGERGLKSWLSAALHCKVTSLSLRRAWIEIKHLERVLPIVRSLSLRRAWIEMLSARKSDGSP